MNKSVHIYVVKLRSKMQLDPQDFGVSRVIFFCVVVFCLLACLSVCLIELMFAHTHTLSLLLGYVQSDGQTCLWVVRIGGPFVLHICSIL